MSFSIDTSSSHRRTRSFLAISIATALLVSALISCTKKSPEADTTKQSTMTTTHGVKVTRIDLGRELTSDRRVVSWNNSFAPGDTVFAAVVLTGPGAPTQVTARWSSADGQVLGETTETVAVGEGETATMFHLVEPTGIPQGSYKVEILVDGQVVGSKDFTITAR